LIKFEVFSIKLTIELLFFLSNNWTT